MSLADCWSSALVAAFALGTAHAAQAQTSEIVRGTVTDSAHRAIAGASVVVAAVGTTIERTTTTDDAGHFVTLFASEYRNYSVVVRKIGFAVALQSASRSGLSNVIATTVILRASAVTLAPLAVTAPRLSPRNHVERPSIGGEATSTINSRDFLHDPSRIDSMLALVPGLLVTDGGISALGAPTDQNGTVLDGLPLTGIDLPPDAICGASVATTTSDPSRGGFAGAQTALSSCRGNDYFESAFRGTLNDPALSWTDHASLLAPPRIAAISGFVSGPL
ncbi:MAG TPA: carboxypeptidase regulatory-like domain-containing protein, partial [Gemmatimonadales bacterium]|nr:carboxypeptidase regulatory-like domain-containing protein [Gemmatimonadales bacterium]